MGIRRAGSSMCVFFVVLLTLAVNSMATAQPNPGSERVAAVMAPLSFMPPGCRDAAGSGNCSVRPEVMPYFDQLLADARNAGVTAVSVDVWWRLIEGGGENQFDWTYYDAIFDRIHAAGLKIVPILSFHRCGTGPGDDCDFPLPDWIWTNFLGQGLSADDLKYESETGHRLDDALPPWLSKRPEVLKLYSEVIAAFGQHYAGSAPYFLEVNISLGPTGELRYPAYNGNDCTGFPDRGNFQAYSRIAQQDFREWALARFGGLSGVASRWGITLSTPDEIRVPDGDRQGGCGVQRRAQGFVDRRDYMNIQYGRDFIDWYNDALASHGERLLREADKALAMAMPGVPLGMKIPGVHWQMKCTPTPRIAEITAGLVQSKLNLEPVDAARADAFGYRNILDMVARVKGQISRPLVLHFTALEMTNAFACPIPPSGDDTSMAEALVFWIAQSAKDRDLVYRGENALACVNDQGWDHITNAFRFAGYSGLTLLRLEDAELRQRIGANAPGCASWNGFTRDHYKTLISQCITTSCSAFSSQAAATPSIRRLGATYDAQATTFALWSPDSDRVELLLGPATYAMARIPDADGYTDVYAVTVPGNHHLKPYAFRVAGKTVRDPYGVMVDPNSGRNIVIDMAQTEPPGGWAAPPPLAQRTDAIIYEVHVRDFTVDPDAGTPPEHRGRFLGMIEPGTRYQDRPTGLDHLVKLGVTHVQIMPIFDFSSCSSVDPNGGRKRCYNWGYDPDNYNVPEERYALSASDYAGRIRDLKTMIDAFHRAGIRVIMDVVYNHVPSSDGKDRVFGDITSRYFLPNDLSGAGRTLDGSNPMVSRMIRDSLEFWADQYHVDGFRFDLLGVFDYATVADWARYLDQRFPGRALMIYGEPWAAVADPRESARVRLGSVAVIADVHVGVFNSQFRDAIRGANNTGDAGGYAFNEGALEPVTQGSRGAIRFSPDFSSPLPNLWDPMFAAAPEQSINYAGAHDNLSLFDRVLAWANRAGRIKNGDYDYLVRIQEFALSIVLTSQGIPFIHGGDEMLRTKLGIHDSFSAPDMANMIRWDWAVENADVVDYTRYLIALRRAHPAFRLNSWDAVDKTITSTKITDKILVNRINGAAAGDSWKEIVVIYNSGPNQEITLDPGDWHVALEKSAPNIDGDRTVSGGITAEGTAVTIVYKQ